MNFKWGPWPCIKVGWWRQQLLRIATQGKAPLWPHAEQPYKISCAILKRNGWTWCLRRATHDFVRPSNESSQVLLRELVLFLLLLLLILCFLVIVSLRLHPVEIHPFSCKKYCGLGKPTTYILFFVIVIHFYDLVLVNQRVSIILFSHFSRTSHSAAIKASLLNSEIVILWLFS